MAAHDGNIIKRENMLFAFEKAPRISLGCKLVPVQYREYKYGLLQSHWTKSVTACSKTSSNFCDKGLSTNVFLEILKDSKYHKHVSKISKTTLNITYFCCKINRF